MPKQEEPKTSNLGKVEPCELTEEMKGSYLDYAMSVIVSRALPDVCDGLKPVHRRILYAMWEMGLKASAKFRKSAAVVGQILGRYHPHGDAAAYDSLVRMTQDFSLRYPLVAGQGNFGCFTKDTKVKLTDGRDITFKELVKEDRKGKRNYTYTFNQRTQKIEIAEIKNPRLTWKKDKVMEISLDSGEKIKCTLYHLFMLRDGTYKDAKDLKPGDSLMPLYTKLYNGRADRNLKGYAMVYQPIQNDWQFIHHLADKWNLKKRIYKRSAGKIRHQQHSEYREHISELMKRKFKDPKWRKKLSQRTNKLWENPDYRDKYPKDHFSKMAKRSWKNPAMKEFHRGKNIRQWQDAKFRKKISKARKARNMQRIEEDPDFMRNLTERAKIALRKNWKDPSYKEKVIKGKVLAKIYEEERANNGVPKLENALNYFNSFSEITKQAQKYNHKVVAVKVLRKREDVYDLTIEPWHNFALAAGVFVHNSLDGDSAAAYRYTECRLSPIAEEMLYDLDKETVDFIPNYDGTQTEPRVLPAKLPNLLLNGSMGIAVGMATNIPPHNLGEVCDGIIHLIDHPKATVDDLIEYVKGPDFPTGALIFNPEEIKQVYASGKGSIVMRARTEITEEKLGQFQIIITEIPYQVNKAALLASIANLVKEKRIEGIKDMRDETDRTSSERGFPRVRIVIDLKSGAYPQKVLNRLFKLTQLQTSFHTNMVCLVEGIQPRLLNLKSVFEEYIKHRQLVVKRRTEFDLARAKERTHILEGLKIALKKIDLVIKTIKKSKDREDAKKNLIKKFKLTERQAIAILEIKLQNLARLEAKKIEDELKEKKELIKELEIILKGPRKILTVIKKELAGLKARFVDERRTQIIPKPVQIFSQEDLIPDEPAIIMITRDGYIKRLKPESFRLQRRGGKGVVGLSTKEEDILEQLITTTTHSNLLFFTSRGRVFQLQAYEVPETSRIAKGQALVNFLSISSQEKVTAAVSLKELKGYEFLVMVTRDGTIKKVDIKSFASVRRSGLIAIKLKGDDELRWVKPSTGKDEIILVTALGQVVRFQEKDVRPMGRTASGVRGIRLRKGDRIVGMGVTGGTKSEVQSRKLLVVSEKGFGKKTKLENYRLQHRGGSGIKTARVTDKTGKLVSSMVVDEKNLPELVKGDLIVVSARGQVIRLALKIISTLGRATQGVHLMKFKDTRDKVVSVTLV